MKDTQQGSFEDYLKKLDAMEKQAIEGMPGVIKELNVLTNHKFYDSDVYEERNGFGITVETEDGTETTEFISIPQPTGFQNSNMQSFKKKYGGFPKVGLKVMCKVNDEGFLRIDYPHVEVTE